jgi:hypothetical protein
MRSMTSSLFTPPGRCRRSSGSLATVCAMCARAASPPQSQRNCSCRSSCWVSGPSPLTSRGKAAAMLAAPDVAAAAAEGPPLTSSDAKVPLAADVAAAGKTGDLAELEGGTEQIEPAAIEPGEASSPGAECADGGAGEVAAAAEAGARPVAGTAQTGRPRPRQSGTMGGARTDCTATSRWSTTRRSAPFLTRHIHHVSQCSPRGEKEVTRSPLTLLKGGLTPRGGRLDKNRRL